MLLKEKCGKMMLESDEKMFDSLIDKLAEEYDKHSKYYNPDYLKLFKTPILVKIGKKGDGEKMACGRKKGGKKR